MRHGIDRLGYGHNQLRNSTHTARYLVIWLQRILRLCGLFQPTKTPRTQVASWSLLLSYPPASCVPLLLSLSPFFCDSLIQAVFLSLFLDGHTYPIHPRFPQFTPDTHWQRPDRRISRLRRHAYGGGGGAAGLRFPQIREGERRRA